MEDALATFVNVIIPVNLNKLYTYRVQKEFENLLKPGIRVAVQFGSKKIYAALVAQIHHTPPTAYEAKYISAVIDDEPVVNQKQIDFWNWLSRYYMCSIGDIMNAALPAAMKLQSKTIITLTEGVDTGNTELDDKEYLVIEALELRKQLTLDEVSEVLQIKTVMPVIKSLFLKGIIEIHESINEKYIPKIITCVKLHENFESDSAKEKLIKQLEKNEKQLNVLLAYIQLSYNHKHISKQMLLNIQGVSSSSLNTLIKKNIFELYNKQIDRIAIEETKETEFTLNDEQQKAFLQVKHFFNEGKPVLIYGVTGSGKTHVYVNLIKETLAKGKQVLYLLPEIALTAQIIKRIEKYFGHTCVSFHSKYNNNEKVEIWQKVLNKEINLIIGARSALFLPFSDLGLVVIDEEHETAYKQQDPAPRYHARDAAVYLAYLHQSNCILGSATPSVETYYNALTNKYGLVKLTNRHSIAALPEIKVVNMNEEIRTKSVVGNNFSSLLYNTIQHALKNGEQVILFQNRRGYSPILECIVCRWVSKCKNCDIALTYHKSIESLKCHYCGFLQKTPLICPACGNNKLHFKGFGTEKIEDEIKLLFEQARIARLDFDAAKTKHGHEQIISDFEQHRSDILVGTQMLSKGLDFDKVSVAGIINADQLLAFPDFRANERAFQLMEQVAGRTGRRDIQGMVIIQTTKPQHQVIECVKKHDFESMYEKEITDRERFHYPPFSRLIKLVLKHKDYNTVEKSARHLANILKNEISGIVVLGPESPYISKIRNMHIKNILIKINRNSKQLFNIKENILICMQRTNQVNEFKNCIIYADVDPV